MFFFGSIMLDAKENHVVVVTYPPYALELRNVSVRVGNNLDSL